jgi:antitoxin (DNA-binding transcriptional repressor) of toxin-antitoxin stability system
MATTITTTELTDNLTDILGRVRERGERFVIERDGQPVATLAPASVTAGITMRELAARMGDLPLPGESFADDLETIQRSQPPMGDPTWRC